MNGRSDLMKILCFGDSNTYGYDPRSFFGSRYPVEHRWVEYLGWKLDGEVINAGENGRGIPRREEGLLQFNLLLNKQKTIDLLIVMLGVNDLLQGSTVEDIVKWMEYFLENIDLDKSRILLIGPPPMRYGEWVSVQALIDKSIIMNQAYSALAARLGVRFVDAGEWNIPMTFDGIHFTEEGHIAFAEGIINYLNKGE